MFDKPSFWANVNKIPDGCWEWMGSRTGNGYGQVGTPYLGSRIAHRVAWALMAGAHADGLLCHRCDNPICVNPAHLFIGSPRDNMEDMSRKGRSSNNHGGQAITHCSKGHEYTPENTYWRPGKVAARDCRACIRDRVRRYQQRKAAA